MKQETNLENISNALTDTLKDSDLTNLSLDIVEAVIDSELADGVLKELPGLNILYGVFKICGNVRDKLFTKKLISFLVNLKDVANDQRKRVIEKIDASGKYRTKVGEKLLYILDKADDYEKSSIIGTIFKGLLKEQITYPDFIKACHILDKMTIYEIQSFLKGNYYNDEFEEPIPYPVDIEMVNDYISSGLFEIAPFKIEIKEMQDRLVGGFGGYELKNSKIKGQITPIGIKIYEILNNKKTSIINEDLN